MRSLFQWIAMAGIWVVLAGCATTPPIPGASHTLLDFLEVGTTTREQAILKLGEPSSSFEEDSILTWRIGLHPQQGLYVITRSMIGWRAAYSLVLVFDDNGILEESSRVQVQ